MLPETTTEIEALRARIAQLEANAAEQAQVEQAALALSQTSQELVGAFANGQETLAALKLVSYDLVLMDCQMPEMDGFEATRAIRDAERATGGHIPIVALTANALEGDRERCLAARMDDYLPKPITPRALTAALARVTQRLAGIA